MDVVVVEDVVKEEKQGGSRDIVVGGDNSYYVLSRIDKSMAEEGLQKSLFEGCMAYANVPSTLQIYRKGRKTKREKRKKETRSNKKK